MINDITCVIVEDEASARFVLSKMLTLYAPNVTILAEIGSVKEGLDKIDSLKPDLIFLDIELTDGTGFELLDGLDTKNLFVVFTTAFDNYAIKAIKFNAFDYLLKPIDHLELKKAIEKLKNVNIKNEYNDLIQNYKENTNTNSIANHKIVIPNGDKKTFIAINKIVKCIAEKSYTWLYLNDGTKLLSSKNLGEFEKILPNADESKDFYFLRVHHSTMVNADCIKEFRSSEMKLLLTNNELVKVSHRRKSILKRIILQLNS